MTDRWLTVHIGDNRDVLPTLEAGSVHCVVTSPPYWGLRDYGTATWDGGIEDCDHKPERARRGNERRKSTLDGGTTTITAQEIFRGDCSRCGAIRIDSQLGLEATPEQYVANLVDVFRKVRRVLRDDGTVWLNLGDTYAATGGHTSYGASSMLTSDDQKAARNFKSQSVPPGLKPKDLVGIPWRVAFALQADGWYLRSDVIWAKPNPMPESVTDRPTKSHEYMFMLAKSARYYFDQEAVREDAAPWNSSKGFSAGGLRAKYGVGTAGGEQWNGTGTHEDVEKTGRNIRTVWTIATQPYPGAHFATFPPALVEPCVKAGCPENGVVLDPFGGSGTVGVVANRLSRRAVLIELNPDYGKQIEERNQQAPLGLGAA